MSREMGNHIVFASDPDGLYTIAHQNGDTKSEYRFVVAEGVGFMPVAEVIRMLRKADVWVVETTTNAKR